MTRTTVVTGATGFLGARVCEVLVERGEQVVAVGRNFSRFPPLDERLCRRAVAELDDPRGLAAAVAGADCVLHSAALSAPWGRRADFLRVNVEGTRRLLEAAAGAGVRRFVHVSSSSVVFDNRDRRGVDEREGPPRRYLADYPESKALAEGVVRGFPGLETVILRPRGIFGPGDTSILPRLMSLARAGKLRVIGRGDNEADLTYVDNVVHALLLARDAPAAKGNTYFISNDETVKLWDFVKSALRALGLPAPERHVPFPVAFALAGALETLHRAAPSLGEPRLTRYTVALLAREQTLDIAAAKRDLGYAPPVPMGGALERTVRAFREAAHA